MSSKLIFRRGNGIIQTGNGIVYPISRPLIKNFFYQMFLIHTKEFKIDFQNRKWNYLSYFQASDQKLLLPNVSHSHQGVQNWFSKQEMKLFIPVSGLWSKNFFTKFFFIYTKEFKIDFQNRIWNSSYWKWNYLSYFKACDQKISFRKYFSLKPRISELIFKKKEMELFKQKVELFIQFPGFWWKNFLQNVSHLNQGVQN